MPCGLRMHEIDNGGDMPYSTREPRRRFLKGAGMLALGGMAPAIVRAQGEPLQLGVLTPLTGAGGFDGPRMAKAMQAVIDEVNANGGLLGRKVVLVVEDGQTNPEAAVRAARKLIDVTKVPAIMGTWASAVTSAVAPLCWESKTFLTTVSGADSITRLPHQGYLIRTQPNNHLQAGKHADFIVDGCGALLHDVHPGAVRGADADARDRGAEGEGLADGRHADLRQGQDDVSLRGRPGASHQS